MSNSSPLIWNPFRKGFRDNPHENLRLLREQNPIHRGINGYWLFLKFEDVRFLLTNSAFRTLNMSDHLLEKNRFIKSPGNLNQLSQMVSKWLFLLDPPEHAELRQLVVKLWNQYQIQQFIKETAEEAVERMAAKGRAEIIDDFAGYIPTMVISKILGFPLEDYDRLRRWSHYFANTFEPFEAMPKLLQYNENARAVCEYMEAIMEAKRSVPDDSFISRFLQENEALAKPIPHESLISLFTMLFFAGMETSIYLLGQGVLALIEHPAQTAALRRDFSLLPQAVEELVRFISPLQYAPRIAVEDVEHKGHHIRAGELVLGCLSSANRDPGVFETPEELNFTRKSKAHVGFGHGFHHCIGARLARDEVHAAVPALLKRFSKIDLDPESPYEWDKVIVFRRLKNLPVVLG